MSPFLWLVSEILLWLIVVALLFFWLGLLWQKRSSPQAALAESENAPPKDHQHSEVLAAQLARVAEDRDRNATQLAELQRSSVPRSTVTEAEASAARQQLEASRIAMLNDDLKAEQKTLVMALAEATQKLAVQTDQLAELPSSTIPRAEHEQLQQQLTTQQVEADALRAEFASLQHKAQALGQSLELAHQQQAQLSEQNARLASDLATAQTQASEAPPAKPIAPRKPRVTKPKLAAEDAALLAQAIALRDQLHQQMESLKASASRSENSAPGKPLPAVKTAAQAEAQAQHLRQQIAFLQQLIATRSEAAPDDLTQIKGIAQVISKRLQAYGITTYRQLAQWTEAEVEIFSDILACKGRIKREKWQEQARLLEQQKQG